MAIRFWNSLVVHCKNTCCLSCIRVILLSKANTFNASPLWSFILCLNQYFSFRRCIWLQCSRAREPTFKNLHRELPELEKSVKYISLTV